MNTSIRLPVLGLFLAALYGIAPGSLKEATAAILSDELKISDVGGAVPVPIFDFFLPESAPPGFEPDLTWTPGVAGPVPIPIPPLAAIGLPGAKLVVLLEPPGEVPGPGEVPIPVLLPTGQTAILSDLVISTLGITSAPPFVSLLSDGHQDLPAIASALPGIPGVVYLVETGLLQDLTPFLVPPGLPFGVQVASDVTIPEPSSSVLAAFGLIGLVVWRRRKR
jgi:hypothetical protein